MTSLAEALNETVSEEVNQDVQETEQVETTEAPEETGDIKEESTPDPKVKEEPQSVPLSALMAERDKRQAAELRLKEFDSKKEAEPAPDVFENQQGYTDHMKGDFNEKLFNERCNTSEFHARREFKDLDSKVEVFNKLVEDNPALKQQVMSSQSPYHEIYDVVVKHEKMEKIQNVDDYEATVRAEIEAKVRSEMEAEANGKAEAKSKLRDSVPTSLVNEPSKGTVSGASWNGPKPLDSIFN